MNETEAGLARFYSSQADLILCQYENINQLLGKTDDWTHPGTHCEILLRDFLRRNLLSGMGVDKGFVYGRVERDGTDYHGPEIDILIHDIVNFRPLFRVEDFVIVQPEAVLGMIQVKRAFWASGDNQTLRKGVSQLVAAKQHLLDLDYQDEARRAKRVADQGKACQLRYLLSGHMHRIFSAVVAFEDKTKHTPELYSEVLKEAYADCVKRVQPGCLPEIAGFPLPHFVGSLNSVSCYVMPREIICTEYNYVESVIRDAKDREVNIGLQVLLWSLTKTIFEPGRKCPPFAFPNIKGPIPKFSVL